LVDAGPGRAREGCPHLARRLPGFLIATGCCGSGVGALAGIGQLVADLILERTPSVDAALFKPDRFGPVDPSSAEFRARCVAARAGKSRGRYPG